VLNKAVRWLLGQVGDVWWGKISIIPKYRVESDRKDCVWRLKYEGQEHLYVTLVIEKSSEHFKVGYGDAFDVKTASTSKDELYDVLLRQAEEARGILSYSLRS
jgi:hypothetical protein